MAVSSRMRSVERGTVAPNRRRSGYDGRVPETERRRSYERLRRALLRMGDSKVAAILDHAPAGSCELYVDPLEVVEGRGGGDLEANFARLEDLRRKCALVGAVAYEAGEWMDESIASPPSEAAPLLWWFGAYRGSRRVGEDDPPFQAHAFSLERFETDISRERYLERVRRILQEIAAGNVYQVNFTIRLRFVFHGDPRSLFLDLRRSQPVSPAMLLRRAGDWTLCFSPELFFRESKRRIKVQPMKGTMPRGRFSTEDDERGRSLQLDPKNRAENLMIVDLMRNDLGRVCRTGSIQVESLFDVRKLPTLWQMTSSLRGELREEASLAEVFRALFPPGSVTGAPKLAAMDLIRRLEGSPRGVYCGALGKMDASSSLLNVGIRTLRLLREDGKDAEAPPGRYCGELGIGSGIVADSDPASEWEESQLKRRFLSAPAPSFELIETIRFEEGFHRLEEHIARMARSARYFAFEFDEDVARRQLRISVPSGTSPQRVRLLLNWFGEFRVETRSLEMLHAPVCVGLAEKPVDSSDPFLFHKTTWRPLYSRARQEAQQAGLWDLIFVNERGAVTEGSICNVFIRRNGKWLTPPLTAGLLDGVMRRRLLVELKAEEREFPAIWLTDAEQIVVSNSVRGAVTARFAVTRKTGPLLHNS